MGPPFAGTTVVRFQVTYAFPPEFFLVSAICIFA
jgi:hypothetical protein